LDLVKCRRQVDPKMYRGNFEAWGKIARAEGFRGVYTGWGPTFLGYSVSNNIPLYPSLFQAMREILLAFRFVVMLNPCIASRL
jgi:hypothetical protein